MPICKNCNKKFPNWVEINGVKKSLSNRKYCLDCNPYGGGNGTHWVYNPVDKKTLRECKVCGKKYPYNRKAGHRVNVCGSCKTLERTKANKIKSVDYCGGKCQICGYSRTINALSFHHVDPRKKEFTISRGYTYSWKKLKKELDKCILLCLVCHAEVHEGIAEIPKSWKQR